MCRPLLSKDIRFGFILFFAIALLVSCGPSGDGGSPANSAPTASSVSITEDSGGGSLSGSYSYADVDGDAEGATTFRWLRNGTVISEATSSTYTLVAADGGQSLTFEVIPLAASGTTTGSAVTSSAIAVNSAPTASSVNITDNNGAVVLPSSVTR